MQDPSYAEWHHGAGPYPGGYSGRAGGYGVQPGGGYPVQPGAYPVQPGGGYPAPADGGSASGYATGGPAGGHPGPVSAAYPGPAGTTYQGSAGPSYPGPAGGVHPAPATYPPPANGTGRPAGRVYGGAGDGGSAARGSGDRRGLDDRQASGDGRDGRRRRTPLWATLTVTVGAVLTLLSGVALAGGNLLVNRYAGNVAQDNLLGGAAVDPGQELTGPINLLLLGIDAREPDSQDIRSDTIIILHVPASHDQVYLISVPRDSLVSVPGHGDMKITEAFYHGAQNGGGWSGGAQLVAQTLHELTGLRFNGAAIINFSGFRKVIDELGGVEFCVDTAATSEHMVIVNGEPMGIGRARREGHSYEQVRYEEGCRQMAGWEALDYARQRKTLESGEGDYGRQRHQQQLLEAMASRATSRDVLTNLGKLDGLVLAAGDALIVDTNGVPLADFVFTLKDVSVGDMVSLRTNNGDYHSTQINGVSYEVLSPESVEMFRAAANDTMAQFVLSYPDFVNPD